MKRASIKRLGEWTIGGRGREKARWMMMSDKLHVMRVCQWTHWREHLDICAEDNGGGRSDGGDYCDTSSGTCSPRGRESCANVEEGKDSIKWPPACAIHTPRVRRPQHRFGTRSAGKTEDDLDQADKLPEGGVTREGQLKRKHLLSRWPGNQSGTATHS